MAEEPASEGPGDGSDGGGDASELSDRVDSLESGLEELDEEIEAMIQDVRDRVIQVKREADAKAPVDHGHPDLAGRVDRLADNVGALGRDYVDVDDDLARLEARIHDVEDRLDAGFSNYEEVLEYLIEATDDLDGKLETLVGAVVDLRRLADRVASAEEERAAVDRLRSAAQGYGVTEAKCEDCGGTVRLSLLTSPECPHCGTAFGDVEPKTGFFGSATLRAGARPALEGKTVDESAELTDLIDADGEDAPAVDHEPGTSPGASTGGPVDEPTTEPGGETGDHRATAEPVSGDAADTGHEPSTPGAEERPAGDGAMVLAVDAISGIGPTYSDRLASAGIETVGELAQANPERLAGATDIARDRIDGWVDRARQLAESG